MILKLNLFWRWFSYKCQTILVKGVKNMLHMSWYDLKKHLKKQHTFVIRFVNPSKTSRLPVGLKNFPASFLLGFDFNNCHGSWPKLTQSQHQSHALEEFGCPLFDPVSADTSCCHTSVLRSNITLCQEPWRRGQFTNHPWQHSHFKVVQRFVLFPKLHTLWGDMLRNTLHNIHPQIYLGSIE